MEQNEAEEGSQMAENEAKLKHLRNTEAKKLGEKKAEQDKVKRHQQKTEKLKKTVKNTEQTIKTWRGTVDASYKQYNPPSHLRHLPLFLGFRRHVATENFNIFNFGVSIYDMACVPCINKSISNWKITIIFS